MTRSADLRTGYHVICTGATASDLAGIRRTQATAKGKGRGVVRASAGGVKATKVVRVR